MTTDKTGAETAVTQEADRFTISVDGQPVGFTQFADRDGQRVFFHTEVGGEFEGRGLGMIVVGKAIEATKGAGLHVVPVCKLVAAYLKKHPELADIVDQPTPEIEDWLETAG